MVFSSHLFIFYFLPLVLLLNYTLPFRLLSLMLVCVSYAFYGPGKLPPIPALVDRGRCIVVRPGTTLAIQAA
jgi:hypothetical protein